MWGYRHYLNTISSVSRAKFGTYIGLVNHYASHWYSRQNEQMAFVQFDGNKNISKVPLSQLEPLL